MDSAMARANRSGDDSEVADGLTRREHDILAFERQWWKFAGVKEDAIKELFSMSATRYYQVLNALVDRPEALAADPMLNATDVDDDGDDDRGFPWGLLGLLGLVGLLGTRRRDDDARVATTRDTR